MPLYLAEACFKYNNREKNGEAFDEVLENFVRPTGNDACEYFIVAKASTG